MTGDYSKGSRAALRRDAEVKEVLPPRTGLAFRAMRELRSGLEDLNDFVRRVDEVQRREGYRLVAVFDDEARDAVAVAGFRIGQNLAWGRYLYVDDLSTLPEARRRGYAGDLLEWLVAEGQRLGCDEFHLDSGVGANRGDAHRLYLNTGMAISAHHFAMSLKS